MASYSRFASLLSADEQGGDAYNDGDEEQAGADALDHSAQRLCSINRLTKKAS